jgi:hypothetical protein
MISKLKRTSIFPAKQGIPGNYSPRLILHQENLSYDKN